MDRTELKKLAIKHLKNKQIKMFKKQLCQNFIDEKQRKECISEFNKNFIKSFIDSYQNRI